MPLIKRKRKVCDIRHADIIVLGDRKFMVQANEPASLVIGNMTCLVLKPLKPVKGTRCISMYVSPTEKFKITRIK